MADLIGDAMAILAGQLKANAGREVTYGRGASEITITGTLGKKLLKVGDEYGALRMVHAERDYVFTSEDIDFGAGQVEPAKGDQITDANEIDGVERTWEVLSPGGTEPPFQYCDSHRTMVRVHCKLIDQ